MKLPRGSGWRVVLFCGCIGFTVPTLMMAIARTGPWWLPCIPIAGIVGCCVEAFGPQPKPEMKAPRPRRAPTEGREEVRVSGATDTLRTAETLTEAGVPERQAAAHARAVDDAVGGLVTREHLDARLAQLETRLLRVLPERTA